jgi:hypothetical protein
MSERGREGRKKDISRRDCASSEGARLPVENIFFHILRSSEARIFPLAGKSAFFRPYVVLFVKIAQLYK